MLAARAQVWLRKLISDLLSDPFQINATSNNREIWWISSVRDDGRSGVEQNRTNETMKPKCYSTSEKSNVSRRVKLRSVLHQPKVGK